MSEPPRKYNVQAWMMAGAAIAAGNGLIGFNSGNTALGVAGCMLAVIALGLIPVAKRRQQKGPINLKNLTAEPMLRWARRLSLLGLFAAMLVGIFDGLPAHMRHHQDIALGWAIVFWLLIGLGLVVILIDAWRRRAFAMLVIGFLLAGVAVVGKQTTVIETAVAAAWRSAHPPDLRLVMAVDPDAWVEPTPELLARNQSRIARYMASRGQYHTPQPDGTDRIVIPLSGIDRYDLRDLKQILAGAHFGFHLVHDDSDALHGGAIPDGYRAVAGDAGPLIVAAQPVLTGASVAHGRVERDLDGSDMVVLNFDRDGSARLADVTAENVGRRLAVVFKGRVVMAPYIRAPITGGAVQVSGNFSTDEAFALVQALAMGGLPVPMVLVEEALVE